MSPTFPAHFTPLRRAVSPLAPDAQALERFLAQCHRRRYPTRTDVFRPGDPAGTLYFVVSGSVSIITEEDDGRELVLGYLGSSEFVGEMGLFILHSIHVSGSGKLSNGQKKVNLAWDVDEGNLKPVSFIYELPH